MGLKQIEDGGLAAKVKTDREHVFRSAVGETTRAWAELGQCELQGQHLLRKKKKAELNQSTASREPVRTPWSMEVRSEQGKELQKLWNIPNNEERTDGGRQIIGFQETFLSSVTKNGHFVHTLRTWPKDKG